MHPARDDVLVFDVGGTNLRAAIYSPADKTLQRTTRASVANHLTMPWASCEVIQKHLLEQMVNVTHRLFGNTIWEIVVAFPAGDPLEMPGGPIWEIAVRTGGF